MAVECRFINQFLIHILDETHGIKADLAIELRTEAYQFFHDYCATMGPFVGLSIKNGEALISHLISDIKPLQDGITVINANYCSYQTLTLFC